LPVAIAAESVQDSLGRGGFERSDVRVGGHSRVVGESTEGRRIQDARDVSIHIAGELPDPCHVADIERDLLTVEPPEFIAR
jgi:hypothetical protein